MASWIIKLAALRFFLQGCETYFIAPTAWYYIKSLGQTKLFLAFVLCSYNAGAVISGPLTGFITDRVGQPRLIFLCCLSVKVLAYVIYSVNLSPYFPLFGRLMSGLGNGTVSIILGQITLQMDEKRRAEYFVFLEGIYCLGSAFGPGIGSFITFRVSILGWHISEGNSPGIVLAMLWFLFLIASVLLPNDIWAETGVRNEISVSAENQSDHKHSLTKFHPNGNQELNEYGSNAKATLEWDSRVFCLLFVVFSSEYFSSTSTFYVPILGLDHFHLQPLHIKLLFLNCTIFTLLVFTILYLASEYIDERKILLIAMFVQVAAISFLIALAFIWDKEMERQYYLLQVYICLGMPYFTYPFANSMLSKITDRRNASFIQGLSYAAMHCAIVISRVIVSFVFSKTSLIVYSFIMIFFWFIAFTWYAVMCKHLAPNTRS